MIVWALRVLSVAPETKVPGVLTAGVAGATKRPAAPAASASVLQGESGALHLSVDARFEALGCYNYGKQRKSSEGWHTNR